MLKLVHDSTEIMCRGMNFFLFYSLPVSCDSGCACKQARYVCIHNHYYCEGGYSGTYIYICVCLQSRFLCVRGRSHFHSQEIFSIRTSKKHYQKKKPVSYIHAHAHTHSHTHTCRQFMTVCNVAASALIQFEKKHGGAQTKKFGGRR